MTTQNHLRLVEEPLGGPPPEAPVDPLVGKVLDGRYLIEKVLGEGGMGVVYRAKHTALGKNLAVKVLRAEVSKDQEIVQRFRQEAQSATAIGNEHIIDISDFGTLPDGSTYFVMEFLDGIALTKAMEETRPLPVRRTVHIAKQICTALGAAHERGIVHRDLKPDNVYLVKRSGDSDFVKVLDFGIAKVGGATSKLTRAGQVFGTPHYMSPEQCAGTEVDQRTDIYALGVILYEMCSGRVPFDADNLMGILTKHLYETPIPPRELPPPTDVPPALEQIILKALAKRADDRYQSMAEMREDLERVEQGIMPLAAMDAVDRASRGGREGTQRTGLAVGVGDPAEAPKKNLLPLVAAGAVAALLLVGGAVGLAIAGSGRDDTPAVAVRPVAPVTGQDAPAVVAGRGPAAANSGAGAAGTAAGLGVTGVSATGAGTAGAGAGAAGSEAPRPALVRLQSNPPGAEIFRGAALLGNTPREIEKPTDGSTLTLTLRLAGYQDREVAIIRESAPELTIGLERERPAVVRGGGATKRPAGGGGPSGGAGGGGRGASEVINPWDSPR
jgi:serine/threonine-protein kinase